MATETMGVRAYGRRRGVSHTAVQRAIQSGRLVRSVTRDANGAPRIDPELADSEWTANTDQSQQRQTSPLIEVDPSTGQTMLAGTAPPAPDPAAKVDPNAPARSSYATSRAVREQANARLLLLELELQTGKLVNVEDVVQAAASAGRRVREGLMNIPARISAELAATRNARDVHTRLEREIAAVLGILATEVEGLKRDLAKRD